MRLIPMSGCLEQDSQRLLYIVNGWPEWACKLMCVYEGGTSSSRSRYEKSSVTDPSWLPPKVAAWGAPLVLSNCTLLMPQKLLHPSVHSPAGLTASSQWYMPNLELFTKIPGFFGLFRLSACLPSGAFRFLRLQPASTTDWTLTYQRLLEREYPYLLRPSIRVTVRTTPSSCLGRSIPMAGAYNASCGDNNKLCNQSVFEKEHLGQEFISILDHWPLTVVFKR